MVATKRAAVKESGAEYGQRCNACGRRTYCGDGHTLDCPTKARSVAYNAELRTRLDRAAGLAEVARAAKDTA